MVGGYGLRVASPYLRLRGSERKQRGRNQGILGDCNTVYLSTVKPIVYTSVPLRGRRQEPESENFGVSSSTFLVIVSILFLVRMTVILLYISLWTNI